MRYSRHRELILETLKGVRSHPTAEEIYAMVRVCEPNISLGTVYRNLGLLAERGEILRISSACGDRFDFPCSPHYHIRCVRCGRVEDIDSEFTAEISSLAARLGAENMLAEGLCQSCRS